MDNDLNTIRDMLDAAGVPVTDDDGNALLVYERVRLLAVKRDAAVQLCGELAEEKEAARRDLDEAQALLAERAKEIAGHEASVNLRHEADMRGIALWRAESPDARDLTWPSHDELVSFLLQRLTAARYALVRAATALGMDADHPQPEALEAEILNGIGHARLDGAMIGVIREITDAAGHDGVAFLDDAVRNIRIERDRARADLDKLAAYLEVPPDEPGYAPRAERVLTAIETLNEARADLHAQIDALRTEFNARIRAEEDRTQAARIETRQVKAAAATLAQAAAAARDEMRAMGPQAVHLEPVEVHADELATSLGRFPMVRHHLPDAIVVALRVLPGDAQLAQHFAEAVRARFGAKALVVLSREAPSRAVRLFRVVPADAPEPAAMLYGAPLPDGMRVLEPEEAAEPSQMREQDAATLGQPIPPPTLADYERALATQYTADEVAEIVNAAQERAGDESALRNILRDACRMAVAAPPVGMILAAIRSTQPAAALETAATP